MERARFTQMKDGTKEEKDKRERHRGHIYFDDCAGFYERWDQASFDPDYDDLPLEFSPHGARGI